MFGIIPSNNVMYLHGGVKIDSWGQKITTGELKPFQCFSKQSQETVVTTGGKQVTTHYSISVNNECEIRVGDTVDIDGERFTVLTKALIRDFNGSVIYTKYSI